MGRWPGAPVPVKDSFTLCFFLQAQFTEGEDGECVAGVLRPRWAAKQVEGGLLPPWE